MATRAGRLWVTLSDKEDAAKVFDPDTLPLSIETQAPTVGDEKSVSYRLSGPFHPQVTTNTVIDFVDRNDEEHTLYVMGVQNVGMLGREMVVLAEEALDATREVTV